MKVLIFLLPGLIQGGLKSNTKITAKVRHQFNIKSEVPILVQLTPASLPLVHPDARSSSSTDMDTFAAALVNKLNRHGQRTSTNIKGIFKELNITDYRYYSISNTYAVPNASMELIEELVGLDEVEEISTNIPFSNGPTKFQHVMREGVLWDGQQKHWSVNHIHADDIPNEVLDRARELRYGNADTGVQFDHPALLDNYFGQPDNHNYAWWDASIKSKETSYPSLCEPGSKVPCDDNSHGTHTTGTAVGLLGLGVAPTTKWMACKNMFEGDGQPESYLNCLQFFLAPTNLEGTYPKPELRPHVIGNSYACPESEGCSRTTFKYALKAMRSAGIFMSVSAGNEGDEGCSSIFAPPAIDEASFNVAATSYRSNRRAYFSSLGPVPERQVAVNLAAPGVNITSCVINGGYASYQGTSMASPHVAGAALLIMAHCPHLQRQVKLVKKVLELSANPIRGNLGCGDDNNDTIPNNEFGYGGLNVKRALEICPDIWD